MTSALIQCLWMTVRFSRWQRDRSCPDALAGRSEYCYCRCVLKQDGHSPPTITIESLPAEFGDCFLVRCVSGTEIANILVDGGPAGTYDRVLKARLLDLTAAGEELSLVVVTHVDNDHIVGIIDFLSDNGPASSPQLIRVGEIWHNSYRHLPISKGSIPTASQSARIRTHARRNVPNPGGQVGAWEGSTLAATISRLGYNWNTTFGGGPILAGGVTRVGPALVKVLSPTPDALGKLVLWWQAELIKMGVSHDAINSLELEESYESKMMQETLPYSDTPQTISSDPLTLPADGSFKPDRSAVNSSSVAMLIAVGPLSVLMLADLPSIYPTLLADCPKSVDFVKVSHHGSRGNTSSDFLRSFRAKHFLVTGNGRHGHPHAETLLRIVSIQPSCNLIFNYATEQSKLLASREAVSRFNHTVEVGDGHISKPCCTVLQAK